MDDFRLTERIRHWEGKPFRSYRRDPNRLVHSIIENLKRLFNTRQGGALIDKELGMPDLNYLLNSLPDSINQLEESLEKSIEKYEPRIKSASVKFVKENDNIPNLHFHIMAEIRPHDDDLPIVFESTIDGGGKITVR